LLGDAISTNRQMMEEMMVRQRDGVRLDDNSVSINGCKLLRRG